ncbi:MAG: protocatechuate 3,4-dioxygenase [Pseudomonadota bacterium]|nr:protocatechuate 3,4-dioxygenase [Pseudomonadota bacterium]
MTYIIDSRRRRLLGAALSAAGLVLLPGTSAFAAGPQPTPRQTRGPFYPRQLPLDKDNDLVTVAGQSGIAKGEIANVAGRVLDGRGRPVANARIEIWQCDANGRYHHPGDRRNAPLDPNFQGYGQFITAADGAYRFRTIKPVPYPGRTPHIHFAIGGPDFAPLVTQMYVAGAAENQWDGLFNALPPAAQAAVLVDFAPAGDGSGELLGRFDIVLAADGRFGG